jgi:plastocyanin
MFCERLNVGFPGAHVRLKIEYNDRGSTKLYLVDNELSVDTNVITFKIENIMKSMIHRGSRLLAGLAIFFITLTVSSSCTKTNGGTPGPNEVWMENSVFNPVSISITSGTTITWTNKDGIAHTVTGNDGQPFDSGTIPANGTYTHTFPGVGLFNYRCTFHPSMVATVEVN